MALKLISSLDMNDIKQEDVMLYDEGGQGNVSGAAVVADGATGFLKDVDVRGNLVSLPDIVSGDIRRQECGPRNWLNVCWRIWRMKGSDCGRF